MASFTTNKNLTKPAHNEDVDTWDVPVNSNSDVIDACLGTTNVFNMTSVATKTLVAADYQCTTMKFTGTLGSGIIPVLLPNGVSGQFTIIDATAATDSTSQLGFGWDPGGGGATGVVVNHGSTQTLTADGVNLLWSVAAPQSNPGVTTIDLTGLTAITVTDAQARNKVLILKGTLANQTVQFAWPVSGAGGVYAVYGNYSNAGGSSNLVFNVTGSSGTNTFAVTAGKSFMAGYFIAPGTSNNWIWQKFSADV